ncbi:hypothetical protein ACFV20_19475 [Streptomyces sp. NPDC059696]|uniref:hypothetical protein n=1 Tax=Streptomyces sp. NPDC059696 TaxID=3346911 RepID=UPI0036780AEC
MGLYHSVALAYGFEIPADTDVDAIDRALGTERNDDPDAVGYTVVGDRDKAILCTRFTQVGENQVLRLTADLATPAELDAWDAALHDMAVRLGLVGLSAPGWLLIHNYR